MTNDEQELQDGISVPPETVFSPVKRQTTNVLDADTDGHGTVQLLPGKL